MKTLLSISGGGVMGVGPATFFYLYEKYHGKCFSWKFDAITGTSVGAILAALLATGYSAADAKQILDENIGKVFTKSQWWKIGSKYDSKNVEALLNEKFGQLKMSDLTRPLFITAYDIRKKKLKVFGPSDSDLVSYAVRCSMAAPTYFDPVDGRFVDGGLCANDPTLVGLAGLADHKSVPLSDIRCLSVVTTGTNAVEGKPVSGSWGRLKWLPRILDNLTSGNSADVYYISSAISDTYRVSPVMPDYALDALDQVGNIKTIWTRYYEGAETSLERWLNG